MGRQTVEELSMKAQVVMMAVVMGLVVACDDGDDESEVNQGGEGEEFEVEDPYMRIPAQEGVDAAMGVDDIEAFRPAEEGQVRLGRLGEETGFEGVWSHCRAGDFLMSNAVIEVCIQNETTNRYETFTGGKLVDIRRHGQEGEDVMDMVMPLLRSLSTASSNEVEVVRDGSDGVAVVRTRGEDVDVAHLSAITGNVWNESYGMEVETEFRMYPDEPMVEMVTHLTMPGEGSVSWHVGEWFAYGDRARAWTPGVGFDVPSQEMPWMGAMGDGQSFGLVFEESGRPMGLASQFGVPWSEMRIDRLEITDEAPGVYRRWLVVGDGSMDSVARQAAKLRGEDYDIPSVEVVVRDEGGEPVEGAEVKAYGEDGTAATVGQSDDQGVLELDLEPGDYSFRITEVAGPLEIEREATVEGQEAAVELEIPLRAPLAMDILEGEGGEPVPARVTFEHGDLGQWHAYSIDGSLETQVPTGELRVIVTRGSEYDIFDETREFGPDGSEVDVVLERRMDTDGWRSGDFHQHMEPSLDSRVHVEDRVMENVTQGVDVAVPTDHDIVTDLQPAIDRLGVQDYLATFPGVEISPLYAHYNLYPVPYDAEARGRGTVPLASLDDEGEIEFRRMPEVVEIAREFDSDPVIQMNHARRSGAGMMSTVEFDPEAAFDPDLHEDFAYDFDTMEIINTYGQVCELAADWAGFLNHGFRVAGMGNSDTHGSDGEAGIPRNYMAFDTEPSQITADPVREALRAQQVTVSSHAFVDFKDGTLPGDEVAVEDGEVSFDVRVQTPSWARAESLFVIVNGEVVQALARDDEEAGEVVDFDEVITLDVEEDSWVVFWADGPAPSAPMPRRRHVIGFTNPVYLTTGDGDWEAPGPRALDLDAIDTGYCS